MLIISLTKIIVIVVFIKMLMNACDYEQAMKGYADHNLSGFARDHKRTIASLIKEEIKEEGKVEKISIRGSVKIGENHFHEASIEKRYINILYARILYFLGAVRKEVSFTKNICGTILVITATVFVFK